MPTVRLFNSKNCQAFLLPKGIRFRDREVEIFRRGGEVILRDFAPRAKRRKRGEAPKRYSYRWGAWSTLGLTQLSPSLNRRPLRK